MHYVQLWMSLMLISSACERRVAPADGPVSAESERDAEDSTVISDEAFLYKQLFGEDMFQKVGELEPFKEGSVDAGRIPFSGEWYPENKGGTNIGAPNEATALEKYDRIFNAGKPLATNWEKLNHNKSESWYGHCNGFAASAARHQDPKGRVGRPEGCDPASCVYFERFDIRALLAEVYMNAQFRFLSGDRCRTEKKDLPTSPRQDRADPAVLDACDDLNPGSFHLALTNFVGRQKQTLVIDYNQDLEVWNYPLYKYSATYGKRLNRAEATALTGRSGASDYEFNRAAQAFIPVQMQTTIAEAIQVHIPADAPVKSFTATYDYLLELDAEDRIVGGEWLAGQNGNKRDSRFDHPDFLWIPFEPFEPTGSRNYGNPHVSPKEVIRLWAESMGFQKETPFSDPNNTNKVVSAPASDKGWGQHDHFSLTLDGHTTGAAFLDKKISLQLKRNARLQGDVVLSIKVNGQPAGELEGTGSADMQALFEAKPGINSLDLNWRQKAATTTELSAGFLFYGMR